ncbi:MAG: mechanosensitive ion channel [Clostridium sp.]|jgi:small conductance mechanosensitive channel|nr:mechanosensitive ion channel [Clostridium sp.]
MSMVMRLTAQTDMTFLEEQMRRAGQWLMSKAGMVLLALICLVIGLRLVKWIMKVVRKSFGKSKLDPTVASFLGSIISILLYILVFITVISIMGIQVTSFVTLLGTAGVAIGLAVQGSLSNFAGGVLILILKPFVIGDYIKEDTHGNEGTVISIDIFYTRIRTFDGKVVVIPNGTLSNTSLTNLTKQEKRRIDLVVPVEYDADLRNVKKVLQDVVTSEPMVLQEEPIDIALDEFGDSALTVLVHVWVPTDAYWKTKWNLMEHIKLAFDAEKICIPFNQLDVHLNRSDS